MKKVFDIVFLMVIVTLVLLFPLVALAEGAQPSVGEGYDWSTLGTIAGATTVTLLIVQYCKAKLDKVWKIPTRVLVYVIAFLILLGAHAFGGGEPIAWDSVLVIVVNAFVVALAAMGAYEQTFAEIDVKVTDSSN